MQPIPTPKFEETGFCRCPLPLPPLLLPQILQEVAGSGRGAAGATAVVESLRDLPQLTKLEVNLERNNLGPGPRGLCQSILDLATQKTHQATRRRKSSGPSPMRCRCVGKTSVFDPRSGRGSARSVVVASVGDFGAWSLSAARPQPRRAGGGLSPERLGSGAEKGRGHAVVESEHSNLSPRSIAVLLWCVSWVFAGLGPLRTGVRIRR